MMGVLTREEAVRWSPHQPLKVVAGAGTGKTSFLVDRFIFLVQEAGILPHRILGLTFTRKATHELEERLREKLGITAESTELNIHTFDGFWLQLLLEHPIESKVEEPVNILDDGLSRILERKIIRELEQGCSEFSLTSLHQMNLIDFERAVKAARKVAHAAQLRLIGSDQLSSILRELRKKAFPNDSNHALAMETIQFIEGVALIEDRILMENGTLDYGHILLKAHKLLTGNPAVQTRVRKRFQHLLIDEAQDTNFGQFALLKFIAADSISNVTVVGDERQSIFGFRDADPQSLQDYQATICNLGNNFRSYQAILDLAVGVLSYPDIKKSHYLIAYKGESAQPSVAGFVVKSSKDENQILYDFIYRAINNGISSNDIAVLARARSSLVNLENKLRSENIPTVSFIGGFYRRPEVLDARAYLAYLIDSHDKGALVRILERGLGFYSLSDICDFIRENRDPCFDGKMQNTSITEKLKQLNTVRNEHKDKELSLPLCWFGFMEKADYFASLVGLNNDEKLRAQANLRKLFEIAHRLTMQPNPLSESELLSYLDFNIDAGEEEVEANYNGSDGVVLTTIHRAKGLEFPIVIYCGVHDRVIRRPGDFFLNIHSRAASSDWNYTGMGLVVTEDFSNEGETPLLNETYKEDERAEEKRLDYVALTRAKSLQIISGCFKRDRNIPQALQILKNLAEHSPKRFFFSQEPNAEDLASFLPDLVQEERSEPKAIKQIVKRKPIVPAPIPILRWSFTDFEREYCKQNEITEIVDEMVVSDSSKEAILRGTIAHESIRLAAEKDDWQQIVHAWNCDSLFSTTEIFKWQETVRDHLYSAEQVFSEYPFELLLECDEAFLLLNGVVDRLEVQNGVGRIIDFKTGRWNTETERRASRQLNFYAMAWRRGLWPEVKELKLCIIHLDEQRIIDIVFDPDFEDILKETAKEVIRNRRKVRVA